MLPPFNDKGLLPPNDYELTIEQLRQSILVHGPEDYWNWDTQWRLKLVNNLEIMVKQLWQIGITDIFIDGSFVEDKAHPNDIDGYFVCDLMDIASGRLLRELNKLDEHKVWTWNHNERRAHPSSVKKQLPMWHIYRVELYPHYGQFSGLRDEFGNDMTFPAAFRKTRTTNQAKGIVKIGAPDDSQ